MKFNMRIEDIEVRSCNSTLISEGEHTTAEIVKWNCDVPNQEYCFTVAYWKKINYDRLDLIFVGDRPFEINQKLFMKIAEYGDYSLNNR